VIFARVWTKEGILSRWKVKIKTGSPQASVIVHAYNISYSRSRGRKPA
jgi:hypothetical protein